MKKIIVSLSLAIALLSGYGCSSKTDSTEQAKETNEERIDDQAVSTENNDKDDAEDTSNGLVDLASTGMIEYELSKMAVQQASSAGVKEYAQKAVSEHEKGEYELTKLARELNLTLPTTLSKDGQERIEDLRDEKAGKDFDRKYLSEMQAVNKKAIDVADDLQNDGPGDAVKKFAAKIKADDTEHRSRAEQLEKAL